LKLLKHLILFLLIGFSVFRLIAVAPAAASEGTAILTGPTAARCWFASVLIDEQRYKIVVSCRDLTVPPESETLFYRLWVKRLGFSAPTPGAKISAFGRSVYLSLGDITSGKLAGDSREPFDEIAVTAEKEDNPSRPNLDKVILSGSVQPIDYGAIGVGETLKPTSPLARVTLGPSTTPAGLPSAALARGGRSVVGTAFRIFLTVLLIIVVVAVIISVIQRRSASK
jgi:hypothetical protein